MTKHLPDRRRTALAGAIVGLAVASLTGCSSAAPASDPATGPASATASATVTATAPAANADLRVAFLPTANYLTILAENDTLADALAPLGSKPVYLGPSAPVDALSTVTSGNADISSTGTGYFLNLVSESGPWVAFALERYSGNSQGIVAAPDSGIETLEDLYGKKVGIGQAHGTGEYVVNAAFAAAGLDPSKVEKVELAQADYAAAFTSGQIDALATFDQNLANALSIPGAKLLADGSEYGGLNWSIHIASKEFAAAHPDLLKAAYEALAGQAAAAKADPTIITNAYKEFGASDEILDEVAKFDIPVIEPLDAAAVENLKKQAQQYVDFGWFDAVPDIGATVLDVTE